MTDFALGIWAVVLAMWLGFVLYIYWIARRVWKDQLLKCPETGSIVLVGVDYASPQAGSAPVLTVQRCGLWPDKAGCVRGCLAHYDGNLPVFPANLNALRPYIK